MTSAPNTEGMPGVLVEAGLSGIPVVSTVAAGVLDVVEDGVTGYIVKEPADAAAIAGLLVDLLGSPELCTALGAAARERCLTLFSIEASAASWRGMIEDMATTLEVAR